MTHATPPRFLFLLSSARTKGNSEQLARRAATTLSCPCHWLDLAKLSLPAFVDPRPAPPARPDGDLAQVVDQMRRASDLCIVAPVYWYGLPAPAKLLLDHWSGFLDLEGLGFPLWIRTKRLWLITTRADPDPSVAEPSEWVVRRTAEWLGMAWGGALHGVADAPGDIVRHDTWRRAPDFFGAKGSAHGATDQNPIDPDARSP
ncbi:MAG: flavodoxin family protein [Paracoccaceae bacterium]